MKKIELNMFFLKANLHHSLNAAYQHVAFGFSV